MQEMRWRTQPDRGRSRDRLLVLVPALTLALVVTALSFAYVWQTHRWRHLTASLDELHQAVDAAHAVNRVLALRIEEAFSLERVARIARERLGMAEPSPGDLRYVELLPTGVH